MKSYSPRHRVIARNLLTNEIIRDLSPDIVTVTTNKRYGVAAGTFQITTTWKLIDGKRYDQILKPNDVITIELDKGDGKGFRFVMVGLIDRPAKSFDVDQNGSPKKRVKISGRDFGKILTCTELGWDISGLNVLQFSNGMDVILAAKFARYMNQSTTPQTGVEFLFDIFKKQVPGDAYTKFFNLKIETDDDWKTYYPEIVGLRGTKVWGAMKRMENHPYNTLTTYTGKDGKFYIHLEKTPFDDRGRLARSSFHEITEEDIKAEDIGFSDAERINLLTLWPPTYKTIANGVLDIALTSPECTRVDSESIKVNGVYPQTIDTVFVPFSFGISEDENPKDVENVKKRRDLFWAWWEKNHEYNCGSIAIHGDPDIMQGDGLIHKEDGLEFFIEQVSHIYSMDPTTTYLSQLQVTRGQKH